ncbi:hypothetical protein AB0M34_00725 [Nocardia sp. NPDC050193]
MRGRLGGVDADDDQRAARALAVAAARRGLLDHRVVALIARSSRVLRA